MLSNRLQGMYERTRTGWYRQFRKTMVDFEPEEVNVPYRGIKDVFLRFLEAEQPVILSDESFYFTRTVSNRIACSKRIPHENLTAEWEILLAQGVQGRIQAAETKLLDPALDLESREYLNSTVAMLRGVLSLAERYAVAAEKAGDTQGAALLRKVPRYPAETLREAIQSVFFMFSMFHHSGVILQGLGRMDQYFEPFYQHDLNAGILTREGAAELFSEFFIMLNRENDIYGNIQQGDDGESVMLGGCRRDGSNGYNDLTMLLLECSYDVCMINPKINLRVNSSTPQDILQAGVKLTGRGLGFPQYCNDEQIIPALIKFGYPEEDVRDYTVAACWEFVIKHGRDIPNYNWTNLALAADRAIRKALANKWPFEKLMEELLPEVRIQRGVCLLEWRGLLPNPLFSAFMGQCIEKGRDLHRGGGEHYHLGTLPVGASTAADSLAAVRKFVYEDKTVTPERLLYALEHNYEDDEELRNIMKSGPKAGVGNPVADELLRKVFDDYCTVMEEVKDNGIGGKCRPGTGSAQGYAMLTQFKERENYIGASANGRKEGDYVESSLAPAQGTRSPGILSILKSYSSLDYSRLCNGGPITMEFAPTYFRNADALSKTVEFVRAFVRSGCQQIQMNVLDHAKLRDAQIHPENYRDLIVRVWGWSGYFVELDRVFQNQIIGRQAYGE